MKDYVIITDSCCDLSEQLANDAGLYVIPMVMTISGTEYKNYLDERDISTKAFYDRLRAGETASTSALNMDTFLSVFGEFLEQGKDIPAREAEGEVQPELLFAAAEQEGRRIGEHERHDRGEHGAERDEQRADEVGILLLQDGDDVAEDHVVDGKDGRDGQHDGDEVDQVAAQLPPHVAHRELKEHRLHPPKKRPS